MSDPRKVLRLCGLVAAVLATACDYPDDYTDYSDPYETYVSTAEYGGNWVLDAPDPGDCRHGLHLTVFLTIVGRQLDQGFFDDYYAVEGLDHRWRSDSLTGYVKGRLQAYTDEPKTYVRLRFYGPMGEPNYLFTFDGHYVGDRRMNGVLSDNGATFGTPGCNYWADLVKQ